MNFSTAANESAYRKLLRKNLGVLVTLPSGNGIRMLLDNLVDRKIKWSYYQDRALRNFEKQERKESSLWKEKIYW